MKYTTMNVRESLKDTFQVLKHSEVDGVPGVLRIQGKNPGPTLGITVCTHGNEPAGLAIAQHLLETIDIAQTLEKGVLFIVLNNIEATEKYFNATSVEEIRKARYCDINMNRLPKDVLQRSGDERSEVKRAQELYPIWKQFDFGLDVHSTLETSTPMIISRGNRLHSELIRGFPIPTILTNIDLHQIGSPAFAFYGGKNSSNPVCAIEAGQHEEKESLDRAATCAIALLQNLGMLSGKPTASPLDYEEYEIAGSIVFPDLGYDFVRQLKHNEFIKEGEILAESTDGKEPIRMPFDGHLIMPSSRRGQEKDISEEASFLSRPVRKPSI